RPLQAGPGDVPDAGTQADHRGPPRPGNGWLGSGEIEVVANLGGHTTSRRSIPVHSQITLTARRFAPASAAPGPANSSPLPLGSPPCGTRARRAASATDAGVSVPATGITEWNMAHAAEKPASAGALISR